MSSIREKLNLVIPFTIAAFALGMSEFVVIGMLSNISESIDVDISQAGYMISAYALGICVGTPVVTYLTRHMNSTKLCSYLMIAFSITIVGTVSIDSFYLLLLMRVLGGAMHGTFVAIATATLSSIEKGSNTPILIAIMFTGLTVAMVVGVPIGIQLASHYSWKAPFVAILLAAIASALMLRINAGGADENKNNYITNISINVRTLCFVAITVLGFGGGFYLFSYVEPYLISVHGFTDVDVSILLFSIGAGALIGNIAGGVLPARIGLDNALMIMVYIQGASLLLLANISDAMSPYPFLIAWSISAFSIAPMVQCAVVSNSNSRAASCINVIAFNVGILMTTYAASVHVDKGEMSSMPAISASIVFVALLPCILIVVMDRMKSISTKRETSNQNCSYDVAGN